MAKNDIISKNSKQSKKRASSEAVGTNSRKRKNREDKIEKENTGLKFLIFFLILVIIGLSIGILCSPAFNLNEVIINDGVNVKKEEISSVINVKYGENILKQNYKTLKNEVKSLPYVEDTKIMIRFPDKIEIGYTERKPYALIKFLESYFVVDKFGYLLEIKKDKENIELPVIYGIDVDEYELGEKLSDTSSVKLRNVVTLIETAEQRDFSYAIREINYEEIAEVKMWLEGHDIEIIYGQIDRNIITEKLKYLEQILENLKGKKGRLDISSEEYFEKSIFVDINNM
ncbi:MAG: FtsQ-type POTRA domain-containing protein [Clostridia bacterium]|nr:FtsQ-type POTRA domain-containing protein [Clostridia bacterium]